MSAITQPRVRTKLTALLSSEVVAISAMTHEAEVKDTSVEHEGIVKR